MAGPAFGRVGKKVARVLRQKVLPRGGIGHGLPLFDEAPGNGADIVADTELPRLRARRLCLIDVIDGPHGGDGDGDEGAQIGF